MSIDAEPAEHLRTPVRHTSARPKRHARRSRSLLGAGPAWGLASAVLTLSACGLLAVTAARGLIGAQVASAWLAEHGVPAELSVERLDATGFVGAVRLGDPARPDFTSEHVELAFTPALTLRSARLVRPRLRVGFDGRRFNFGSLQALVDQALRAKPSGAPGPDITLEDGSVALTSPYGPVRAQASARVSRGQLISLDARLEPTRLAAPSFDATVTGGRVSAQGLPGGMRAQLHADVRSLRWRELRLSDGSLQGALDAGWRGLVPAGPTRFEAALTSSVLTTPGLQLRRPEGRLTFQGTASGPLDRLDVEGRLRLAMQSQTAAAPGRASLIAPRFQLDAWHLHIKRTARDVRAEAAIRLNANAARIAAAGLSFQRASLAANYSRVRAQLVGDAITLNGTGELRLGSTAATGGGTTLLNASARGDGRWTAASSGRASLAGRLQLAGGLPAATAQRVAGALPLVGPRLARALTQVRLDALDVTITAPGSGRDLSVLASAPVIVTGQGGARLRLSPLRAEPLFRLANGEATGAGDLTAEGVGFSRFRVSDAGFKLGSSGKAEAQGRLALTLDRILAGGAAVEGLGLDGPVRLERAGEALRVTLPACIAVRLARYGLVARAAVADVCPQAAPLLQAAGGRWTVAAELRDTRADLVAAQVAVAGAGRLTAQGGAGQPTATIALERLTARDLAPATRFAPIQAAGRVELGEPGWTGRLDLATPSGQALGQTAVKAALDGRSGTVELDTGLVRLAQNGFQPDALSPLAPKLVSKLDGLARFTGRIAWAESQVVSGGRLETPGLDATGPLGRMTGIKGAIEFTSLSPLTTAPGQALTAESVAWIAPLSGVRVRFQLAPGRLALESAEATVSGGRASLDPMIVPLATAGDPAPLTTKSVLHLAGIDVGELIARSSLADKLKLQAKLSGSVPFSLGPEGVRFIDGRLAADGPGRLSIRREALAGGAVKTSGVQDLAYQALENLAFDTLQAEVGSQAKGRLGVLFKINGRHDPPQATEARIGIFELVSGHVLDRSLPLPKGTPVNLTLDTSLNFDELLAAYQNAARVRSDPVQSPEPKK